MNTMVASGFPDPPRLPHDDETSEAIGNMVLRLPTDEAEVVWGCYLRIRWHRTANAQWVEHLRFWKTEDCAKALRIPRATFFRRLARARAIIERDAEYAALRPPLAE